MPLSLKNLIYSKINLIKLSDIKIIERFFKNFSKFMASIKNTINKIGNITISLKMIVTFLITLLIVFYFFKEQVLFEDLLKILVPFLVGASMKVSYYFIAGLV